MAAVVTTIESDSPSRMFGASFPYGVRRKDTVSLDTGDTGLTNPVGCLGAKRVHWDITCDKTDTLTAASVVVTFTDGRTITIVPGALQAGTDGANCELNAAGVATGVDLSNVANHRSIILRPSNNGVSGAGFNQPLAGVAKAQLTLTKGAVAGPAVYTVIAQTYY